MNDLNSQTGTRMKLWVRFGLPFVCAIYVGTSLGLADDPATVNTDAEPRRTWHKQLEAMNTDLVSGEFRLRLYRFSELPAQTVSRSSFHKLLAEANLQSGPDRLGQMHAAFPADSANFWPAKVKVTFAAEKLRNDWSDVNPVFEGSHVFDGRTEVEMQRANNNATTLYAGRTALHMISPGTLRFLPAVDRNEGYQSWRVLQVTPSSIRVANELYDLVEVDRRSGIPRRVETREVDRTIREVHQFRFTTSPEGITLPTTTVHARFKAGFLEMLSIYVVDSLSLNREIGAGAFRVGVPKGATIIDRRGEGEPKVWILTQAVNDIAATPQPVAAPQTNTHAQRYGAVPWKHLRTSLFVGTAMVLIGVAWRLVSKRRNRVDQL